MTEDDIEREMTEQEARRLRREIAYGNAMIAHHEQNIRVLNYGIAGNVAMMAASVASFFANNLWLSGGLFAVAAFNVLVVDKMIKRYLARPKPHYSAR